MKLDPRIIQAIRRRLQYYDPHVQIPAEDFKALKDLSINNSTGKNDKGDIDLTNIGNLWMLESLSLTGFALTEKEVEEISKMKSLKRLSLIDCTGERVQLPNLDSLQINGGAFSDISFSKLPKEYMILGFQGENIEKYIEAEDPTTMESLTVISSKVSSLDILDRTPKLKKLSLLGNTLPSNADARIDSLAKRGVKVDKKDQHTPMESGRSV